MFYITEKRFFDSLPRKLSQVGLSFRAEEEHPVLHLGNIRALQPVGGSLLGLFLDQPIVCPRTHLHRYIGRVIFILKNKIVYVILKLFH